MSEGEVTTEADTVGELKKRLDIVHDVNIINSPNDIISFNIGDETISYLPNCGYVCVTAIRQATDWENINNTSFKTVKGVPDRFFFDPGSYRELLDGLIGILNIKNRLNNIYKGCFSLFQFLSDSLLGLLKMCVNLLFVFHQPLCHKVDTPGKKSFLESGLNELIFINELFNIRVYVSKASVFNRFKVINNVNQISIFQIDSLEVLCVSVFSDIVHFILEVKSVTHLIK